MSRNICRYYAYVFFILLKNELGKDRKKEKVNKLNKNINLHDVI